MDSKQGVQGAYNQPTTQQPITARDLKAYGESWVQSVLQELRYSEREVIARWHAAANGGK